MTIPQFRYLFADPPARDAGGSASERTPAARRSPSRRSEPTDVDDLALMHRMAAGDGDALGQLYERAAPALIDFARSIVDARDEADELVQQAFLLLWERAANWDDDAHIRGFLFLSVRRLAGNRRRHQRLAAGVETLHGTEIVSASMAVTPTLPDLAAEHQELFDAVLRAVRALPEPRRTALVLRWRSQLPYEEIARILGVSVAAALQLVTRARATLRQQIGHLLEG